MTIRGFKYSPFSLNFKKPFQSSSQIITERKGFIILLSDEHGNSAIGECSPLPGFSRESIEDAERILKGLQYQIIGFSVEENLTSISNLLSEFTLVPSIVFALEQAIISLCIARSQNFIIESFGRMKPSIDINAVVGFESVDDTLSKIGNKINDGCTAFKIKIGRSNFEDDYNLLHDVRVKFGSSIKIRLDANRKFKFAELNTILNRLSKFNIEYIEEPCADADIDKLPQQSGIQFAADESIHSKAEAERIINESGINFIVLKPVRFGGIISSFHMIKNAEKMNKIVVISSSFESAVGKSALVLLAGLTNHTFAHGLDTSDYFEKDLCKDPFEVSRGEINAEHYPPKFNLSFL